MADPIAPAAEEPTAPAPARDAAAPVALPTTITEAIARLERAAGYESADQRREARAALDETLRAFLSPPELKREEVAQSLPVILSVFEARFPGLVDRVTRWAAEPLSGPVASTSRVRVRVFGLPSPDTWRGAPDDGVVLELPAVPDVGWLLDVGERRYLVIEHPTVRSLEPLGTPPALGHYDPQRGGYVYPPDANRPAASVRVVPA